MIGSNTYKALIATALVSTLVLYLGFTVHIKKKSELVAETYYEVEPEPLLEEEKEELEELQALASEVKKLAKRESTE